MACNIKTYREISGPVSIVDSYVPDVQETDTKIGLYDSIKYELRDRTWYNQYGFQTQQVLYPGNNTTDTFLNILRYGRSKLHCTRLHGTDTLGKIVIKKIWINKYKLIKYKADGAWHSTLFRKITKNGKHINTSERFNIDVINPETGSIKYKVKHTKKYKTTYYPDHYKLIVTDCYRDYGEKICDTAIYIVEILQVDKYNNPLKQKRFTPLDTFTEIIKYQYHNN